MKKYILTIGVIVLGFYTYAQNFVSGRYVNALDSLAVGSNVASDGNSFTVDNLEFDGNKIYQSDNTSNYIEVGSNIFRINSGNDIIQLGSTTTDGTTRYINVNGSESNIDLGFASKGTGTIRFSSDDLTDIGSLTVDNININGNTVSTSSGDVQFNTENVIDIATLDTDSIYVSGNADIVGTLDVGGKLTSQTSSILGGAAISLTLGSDFDDNNTLTNSINKLGRFGVPHYTNSEEPIAQVYGRSDATSNQVNIGGGTSQMNAATEINFYTASNTTTTTGTNRLTINSSGDATFSGTITSTGVRDNTTASAANVFINATTGLMYRSTSSRKYKHNIESLDLSESTFKNIRPVEYTSNSDSLQYFGYVAEEIDSLGLTQLVQYVDDSIGNKTPDGLNYGAFTAINTAMIQKLLIRIEELEALVDSLK